MKNTLFVLMLVLIAAPLYALDIYEPLAQDSLWISTKGSAPFTSNPTTTLFGQADYALNNAVLIGGFATAQYNNGVTSREAGVSSIANVAQLADNKAMVDVISSLSFSTGLEWKYAGAAQVRGLLEGGLMPVAQLGFNNATIAGSQLAFSALGGASYLLTEKVELLGNLNVAFGGANINPVLNLSAGSNWLLSDMLEFQLDFTVPVANAGSNVAGSFALYAGL